VGSCEGITSDTYFIKCAKYKYIYKHITQSFNSCVDTPDTGTQDRQRNVSTPSISSATPPRVQLQFDNSDDEEEDDLELERMIMETAKSIASA
jgi:hypothetical protein